VRVDREHVVTRGCERRSDPALVTTADLEHTLLRLG
jgi:hypothetical protein